LSDPEGAALWLTTIPSSDSRSKLLTTTMQHWQRVNPKGAYEWFQGAQNLSAQERAALAAFIKPVPVKPAVVAPKAVPVIR
jgi:hypothetical protein